MTAPVDISPEEVERTAASYELSCGGSTAAAMLRALRTALTASAEQAAFWKSDAAAAWDKCEEYRRAALWQPISTAPDEGYALCRHGSGRPFVAYRDKHGWWGENSELRDPTHWAQIPEVSK
jgi:hypothetical protein